jgi:SnoaL-like domain
MTGAHHPQPAALDLARRWRDVAPAGDAALVTNLLQAYAIFTDAGARSDLAGLFTRDAHWDGTSLGYGVATGPDAIAEVVLAHHHPDRPMVHLPGPPLLLRTGQTLEAFSWTLATRSSDGVTKPLIIFSYHDVLAREDGAWKFRSRLLALTFRATS